MDYGEPIHGWFGLSYANYLVLPRSVLQSMPVGWQRRFVACLEELGQATRDLPMAERYDVRVLAREPERLSVEDCEACEGTGCRGGVRGAPSCEDCDGDGLVDADDRWETPEEVGIVSDPIPHYNRGRTRVELAA